MSSDIFSRPIDVSKYNVIYAGAQKNLAPAGVTIVIVKEEAIDKKHEKNIAKKVEAERKKNGGVVPYEN